MSKFEMFYICCLAIFVMDILSHYVHVSNVWLKKKDREMKQKRKSQ